VKQMTISNAPLVLVLHLKRFAFGGMSDKINRHVEFQPTLSIPITNIKEKGDHAGQSHSQGQGQNMVKYSLCGVLVHHGHSVHSGHYVSYVKVCASSAVIFLVPTLILLIDYQSIMFHP
jgi:ubiquitin carboxyl-terminal hydrolase 36/42